MSDQSIERPRQAPGKVQKQISLPFSKAWEITIKSIKIRLARSLITASGIALGIAFYSSVRAASLFPTEGVGAEAIAAAHRQQWLAVMALVVCFVGIMNSMLMSVTERFKEIGTMKCLGALNRDIIMLFFLEAMLMGLTASVLGWLVGWFIVVLIHLFTGGFQPAFVTGSLMQMAVSTSIGVGITLIAGIPPAINAARMPPAIALRSSI
jgi:putative ABC transport system permease protein